MTSLLGFSLNLIIFWNGNLNYQEMFADFISDQVVVEHAINQIRLRVLITNVTLFSS